MSVFCYKNLDTARHLGAELKEAREKKQLTLDEVERLSFISLKYLRALEAGDFLLLPKGRAHLKAYLRKLCEIYNLNFENIIYKFHCEDGFKHSADQLNKKNDHCFSSKQPLLVKECHLEANGQEIKVDENGKFNTTILLADGVNTLTLSTTKKHGKTTTLVRHVVVNDRNAQKVTVKNLGDKAY